MMDNAFNYIGSYLQDGVQHRELGNVPETLKISIGSIDLNTHERQMEITYNIELLNGDEIVSHYSFISLFRIVNEEFTDSFVKSVSSKPKAFDEFCTNMLVAMIRVSFPFIRQMIHSMTNDLAGAVLLPLIDVSVLLQQGLEFTREIGSGQAEQKN